MTQSVTLKNLIKFSNPRRVYLYAVYMACSVAICWIGVWRDIGTGAQWAFASNCIGLCIFLMTICNYNLKSFFKWPYLIWGVVFSVLFLILYPKLAPGTDYDAQIWSALLDIGLCGILIIRTFYSCVIEKNIKIKELNLFFWLWCVMLVACIISRNEAIWPLMYFVLFLSYYLSPSTRQDMTIRMVGIADGIIISFFWIQIRAFLYRPFDTGAGYWGHFTNANVNAAFYLLSMAGLLTHLWYISIKDEESKKIHQKLLKIILWLLCISELDFVFFTGSRSAFLASLAMAFAYIITDAVFHSRNIMRFCFNGLMVIVLFILLLYPVYACMRYIPALRHHPIWYRDYSEDKVHSYDPIDSPKYTTFEQAVGSGLVMKIRMMLDAEEETESQTVTLYSGNGLIQGDSIVMPVSEFDIITILNTTITINNAIRTVDYPGGKWVIEYDDGVEPGTDYSHRAFIIETDEEGVNIGYSHMSSLGCRRFIWKYFLERLNILGHRELYPSAYIDDYYGHTHNSFLQIGYCFGIIPGTLLLTLVAIGIIASFRRVINLKKSNKEIFSVTGIFPMIFLLGYLIYGMFECLVFTGSFLFSFLFLAFGMLIIPYKTNDDNERKLTLGKDSCK